MSETITHTWQTVEQAAVTLNVSTRTIARRLAGGSLESRVDENGRRLVLVQQINAAAVAEEAADYGVDDSNLSIASDGPVSQSTSLVASPQAVTMLTVLQSTVAAARDDAHTARRTARWAWAGVGVMALALVAGAAVVSSNLTRGTVTAEMLRGQLAETQTRLQQTQSELMATRTAEAIASRDLSAARKAEEQQRADALAATARRVSALRPVAVAPATQPTLIGRVVSLFGE